MIDTTGLAFSAIIGGMLVAIGAGVDSLLLDRHVRWFNEKSLLWWNYFDDLHIVDMPRKGIHLFLRAKNFILGNQINLIFVLRTVILSAAVTFAAIIGGTVLGLYAHGICSGSMPGEPLFEAAWRVSGGASSLLYLTPTNIFFDVATILATAIILTIAAKRGDYSLGLLILADIIICILLFEAIMYATDNLRAVRIAYNGFGTSIFSIYHVFSSANCAIFFILLPPLLYSATILIPTIIYLLIIAALFILRESFKITRWFTLHILERSSEDSKKTLFTHVGVALGILVTIAKSITEIAKLM